MSSQVWFRNPKHYVRELVAAGATRSSWDEGYCKKFKVDPSKFLSLFYPDNVDFEAIVIGWSGAQVLDRNHGLNNPREVHHVWSVTQNQGADLDDYLARARAENFQKMLVVTDLPRMDRDPGKKVLLDLAEADERYPDLKIMLHGLYGFTSMFKYGFHAVDVDPRTSASKGKIQLPNGMELDPRDADPRKYLQWINLMGFRVSELVEARDRCIYNIYSAMWAGENWQKNFAFKSRQHKVDFDVSDEEFVPREALKFKRSRHTFDEYDKLLCNTCSVQAKCKFFRLGSVCSVPGAEPTKLAEMFNTRDADRIIKGLGTVLAAQANRAEEAMTDEAATGELSPEVTKILNSLFSNGVKLAKLVNPELNGKGVNVGIQLNGAASATIAASNSASQLTASIVATLESKGIPREEITPAMIATVLSEADSEQELLELEAPKASD